MLNDVAKEPLDKIEKRNAARLEELRERGIDMNDDMTLAKVSPPRRRSLSDEKSKYIVTSSFTNNLDKPFSGVIRDLDFKELPPEADGATTA